MHSGFVHNFNASLALFSWSQATIDLHWILLGLLSTDLTSWLDLGIPRTSHTDGGSHGGQWCSCRGHPWPGGGLGPTWFHFILLQIVISEIRINLMCYVDAKFLILDKSNNKRHNFKFKDFAAHRQTEFGKVKTSLN